MVVSWTLTPERGGTRLLFEQTPYAGPRAFLTRISMSIGWGLMHKRLIPRVLKNVHDGRFTPGAIPLEKRHYKARAVPDELVR